MEWIFEPTAWVGLFTLIVLEIVLGIDNLVFIAILVDKLPPHQRDKARVMGLSMALVMRLGLLTVMSWLIQLTAPLINLGPITFSGRDLILIVGGFFLLLKATIELHDRVEGRTFSSTANQVHAGFAIIVTQIVVLDAIFSIDAVITAVGMVDHLTIMMAAVIVAIGIMLVASKPLTEFVNQRPTVVILCLGFLLMIGFSLLAEGFGFHLPKGYLYAAIGFSVLIESLNQVLSRNMRMAEARRPLRERTAEAVLRMLGKQVSSGSAPLNQSMPDIVTAFDNQERYMVSGVLTLAERSINSIMTPRNEISWINLQENVRTLREQIISNPHSFFPVCNGSLDEVIGTGRAKEMVADLIHHGRINKGRLREPIFVHESIDVIKLMDILKRSNGQQVLVTDEFGAVQGLVTPIDLFEAIAGEFPDEDEAFDVVQKSDNVWFASGSTDLHHLELLLGIEGLVGPEENYSTLAGYLLDRFDHLPNAGDTCSFMHENIKFEFTVLEVTERRITSIKVERISVDSDQDEI